MQAYASLIFLGNVNQSITVKNIIQNQANGKNSNCRK